MVLVLAIADECLPLVEEPILDLAYYKLRS